MLYGKVNKVEHLVGYDSFVLSDMLCVPYIKTWFKFRSGIKLSLSVLFA
jgi:hypothetical protein